MYQLTTVAQATNEVITTAQATAFGSTLMGFVGDNIGAILIVLGITVGITWAWSATRKTAKGVGR